MVKASKILVNPTKTPPGVEQILIVGMTDEWTASEPDKDAPGR